MMHKHEQETGLRALHTPLPVPEHSPSRPALLRRHVLAPFVGANLDDDDPLDDTDDGVGVDEDLEDDLEADLDDLDEDEFLAADDDDDDLDVFFTDDEDDDF